MPLGKEVPPNEREKEEHFGLSSVKMVADRHRHAAYHSTHWRRAS